jgi:hypothetical protein
MIDRPSREAAWAVLLAYNATTVVLAASVWWTASHPKDAPSLPTAEPQQAITIDLAPELMPVPTGMLT